MCIRDQSRELTALQIALALREEVAALEKAGVRVIQYKHLALPTKRRVGISGVGHQCYKKKMVER